jgi:subtilisin family serine protease
MKRTTLGVLVVLLSTAAVAEETQRYVVATRRPARVAVSALARELRDPAAKRVDSFTLVDGFAATLTPSEAAELRRSPDVRWIEPVVLRHLMADVSTPGMQVVPSGVQQVQAPLAWTGRRTGEVNVAVLDSGIDFFHPDLQPAWSGGYNPMVEGGSPLDDAGHGSHVAGIIAAANNRAGVVGVAPGVRLWGVKVVSSSGTGTMEDVIKGLEWVAAKKQELGGRWVVNLSLGGNEASDLEREAFQKAADAGIVIVASTGNDSNLETIAPIAYPAAYPSVIAVGAVNSTNVRANFSNSGPELDFVAPGVGVLSALRSGFKFGSFVRVNGNVIPARALFGAKLESIEARFVNCGLGEAKDFTPEVNGKIALIRRGAETFNVKAKRAREAGAVAVAFYNHDDSSYFWTLHAKDDPEAQTYPWPIAVGMPKVEGEALAAMHNRVMTIGYESDDYGTKNGTSMSAPHVTGAIALLWSLAPNATPAQMIQALTTTAQDLGAAGHDDLYGHGLIDVNAAARLLAPEAFIPSSRTGRPFLRRQHR